MYIRGIDRAIDDFDVNLVDEVTHVYELLYQLFSFLHLFLFEFLPELSRPGRHL